SHCASCRVQQCTSFALCPLSASCFASVWFFYGATATPDISTLSLHDALPISPSRRRHCLGLLPGRLHGRGPPEHPRAQPVPNPRDRKSTRLNSSHVAISYAVFCLKKKNVTMGMQIWLRRLGQ